jgi:hypothetical protein
MTAAPLLARRSAGATGRDATLAIAGALLLALAIAGAAVAGRAGLEVRP